MIEEYGNKMTPTDIQLFLMISAKLKCHQRNLIYRNQQRPKTALCIEYEHL